MGAANSEGLAPLVGESPSRGQQKPQDSDGALSKSPTTDLQRTPAVATPRGRHRKTDRTSPRRGAVLTEAIKVAEFWKNRRGETVRVTLCAYEGLDLVDLRSHFTAKDGTLQPTRKGLTLTISKLPELVA